VLVASLALLILPAAASAIDVDNTNDSGTGSLRDAIDAANTNPGADVISINTTGEVTLLSALPTITTDVTVTGPGQNQFSVNGADSFQVLRIQSGTVAISGLTITNGHCFSNPICSAAGGGIYNASGTVSLSGVAVRNSATIGQGGGIYNTGTMTLSNSTVDSNTAVQTGGSNAFTEAGGIWNDGTLTLTQSTVSGNTASATGASGQNAPEGGGIFNNTSGTVTVDQTTIGSNHATAGAPPTGTTNAYGGGIDNLGTLIMVRSTVSNNTASGTGGTFNSATAGGIGSAGTSTMTMDRTTVGGNTVTGSDDHRGGGLDLDGTSFTIKSSTIAHNSAGTGANLDASSSVTLKNTILSNPQAGTNCSGVPTVSPGYNIADDASCRLLGTGDQPSTDPMLAGSLGSNGGPTQTYLLDPNSPAVDNGLSSAGESVDQRGAPRPTDFAARSNAPSGDGSDIGAFEVQDITPPDTTIDSGPAATTNDPTPRFTFHASESGSTFQCKIDGHAFSACNSPRAVAHLADGTHTFRVRAKDPAGNSDPSPAMRSFSVKTALVSRGSSALLVGAAPGAKDNIRITRPSPTTIRVTDLPGGLYTGSGIHVGSGCTRVGDYTANCDASGINVVSVDSFGLIDKVTNDTAVSSNIQGGAGNDALIGGSRGDTLLGGIGSDVMKGMNGDDMLKARDMASDTLINCDGGTSPGGGDRTALDALPKDPASSVIGCEEIARP
jgi:hypothetical protein